MANICDFKVKVYGKKNHCYAIYGGQACFDKEIIEESGTEDDYYIFYEGNCKWDLNCYCSDELNIKLEVPEDCDEAFEYGQNTLWTIEFETAAAELDLLYEACWADVDDWHGMNYVVCDDENYESLYDLMDGEEEVVPEDIRVHPWFEEE